MHGWGSWRRDPAITEGERPVGATPREALPNAYLARLAAFWAEMGVERRSTR